MKNDPSAATAWPETAAQEKIPVEGTLSLGRSEKNSVQLPEVGVSRRHALIHCQHDGEFWLVDLGSVNGTSLNARRIFQPVKLRPADRIGMAEHRLVFRQNMPPAERLSSVSASTVPDFSTESRWLLVADLAGFTPLSQTLPPDRLAVLVGGWFLACQKIVEEHDGGIDKYLGDGFFASWPDDGASAVRIGAAARALAVLVGPRFRFVIHRGMVAKRQSLMPGDDGSMGPAVNFVFRMEKLAGQLGVPVLFSAEAHAKLSAHLPSAPLSAHALKGFDGKFSFFVPAFGHTAPAT